MDTAHPRNILAVVAEAAGPDAVRRLIDAAGGTNIYIPKTAGPDHWLSKTIGADAAAAVVAEHRQCTVHVPRGDQEAHRRRRQRIAELAAKGLSAAAIARQVGCNERTVRRVRSEARP